jgi:hypothetical protein
MAWGSHCGHPSAPGLAEALESTDRELRKWAAAALLAGEVPVPAELAQAWDDAQRRASLERAGLGALADELHLTGGR